MYLVFGGKTRPFLEATVDNVGYEPMFDRNKVLTHYSEVWSVSGRIILDTASIGSLTLSQAMSNEINSLRSDLLTLIRPRVTFLHDDLTVSCYDLDPSTCIEGPTVEGLQFPRDGQDIFTSGNGYSFTVRCTRAAANNQSAGILEFSETCENVAGGMIIGHVGGAINDAEKQIFKSNEPWKYIQSGSALGLYGYPAIPNPLFQFSLTRPCRPKYYSAEIIYPVPMRFRVDWSYEFESAHPLPNAIPHQF